MNQELGYLRDELNQKCQSYSEQGNKTTNMVLLVWGGAIIFFGQNGIKLSEIGFEDISLYFAVATFLFISNLVIYYTALKFYNNTDVMYKLAAYIIVFYEKRPSCTVKVGENFSWELATFENKLKNQYVKKNIYKENAEYMALTIASVALMLIFLVPLVIGIFTDCGKGRNACIIMSLIYAIYLVISICWLSKIPKCTYARDKRGMRTQHLKTFIEYAKETGHYTEEELVGRFGKKFLDDIGYTLTATNTVVS
jgi:hypothetical protein